MIFRCQVQRLLNAGLVGKATLFAGYKVGKAIVDIGDLAVLIVLTFGDRHRGLQQGLFHEYYVLINNCRNHV